MNRRRRSSFRSRGFLVYSFNGCRCHNCAASFGFAF